MKRLFFDLDGTLARFNVRNALKRFNNEKGFFAKLLAYKGIEVINELAKKGNVYIISASPNEQADKDKLQWLSKYLPNVKQENITICRIGENKAKIIESKYNRKITKNDLLIDDYTKNLIEWENNKGTGIKRITTVSDNSRRLWKGLQLKDLTKIKTLID